MDLRPARSALRVDSARALALGLRRLRKERGWSQADLAEAADLSVRQVSAIEQQSRGVSLNSIDKLAAAFGLRPSELLAAGEARKRRSTAGDQLAGLLEGLTKRQQGHIIGAVREMRKLIPRRGR